MNRFLLVATTLLLTLNTFAIQKVETFNTKLQPEFVPNQGQIADQNGNLRKDVKFVYAAPGFKVIFKENSWSYEVVKNEYFKPKKKSPLSEVSKDKKAIPSKFAEPDSLVQHIQRIDVLLRNANPNPKIITEEKSSYYTNYYLAHTPEEGVTNIYGYSKITYKDIYPNIDFVFYAQKENKGQLKYDIVVRAGGNINDIKFDYKGLSPKLINQQLNFEVNLNNSPVEFTENIPLSYDLLTHQPIKINYLRNIGGDISFKIADGGKNNNGIVIDPSLVWGTYFGGDSFESSYGVITDSLGNVFSIGSTSSTSGIATSGAYQTSKTVGQGDAYLTKFSNIGSRLWSTYFGGSDYDEGHGVATDNKGNIYITGWTYSTSGIATSGVYQTSNSGATDVYLAKFSNTGRRLWSTYFGGYDYDYGYGVSTDNKGNIFVIGYTQGKSGIASSSAYQNNYGGGYSDAFLAKFSNTGSRLWSTYFGGGNTDYCYGISTDSTGNIFMTGTTESTSGIATSTAYQTSKAGGGDAFLAKFSSSGTQLWSTYFGGSDYDDVGGVINDQHGNVFITGITRSTSGIATSSAYQTSLNGTKEDAFLVKFSNSGTRIWSTYFGGNDIDYGLKTTSDDEGNIYITGGTFSTTGIATSSAYQSKNNGGVDAFLAKFSNSGSRLWSTYFGGGKGEFGRSVASDLKGNIFITGETNSTSGITTTSAYQTSFDTTYKYNLDAFLVKFSFCTSPNKPTANDTSFC